jgi:2-amino-4-hydroxy-6-hydroxymethyldihydropteridine diphosphokinase
MGKTMTDRIMIRDLLVRAILGINPDERVKRQDVLINVTLDVDTRPAAATDAIDDAVNYSALTHEITTLSEGTRYHLIEKLVTEIAWLCLDDRRVQAATVTVDKPTVLRFARSVGITVRRTQLERQQHAFPVYIALGSNIEPERHLRLAVQRLSERCRLEAISPVYENPPVDGSDQPCYFDAVARAFTTLPPRTFKEEVLRAIEADLGRVRTEDPYAARTIDLDLILYGDRVQSSGTMRVPSEGITQYAFVAVPLADLAPTLPHPETGEPMASIADRLNRDDLKRRGDIVLWPHDNDRRG